MRKYLLAAALIWSISGGYLLADNTKENQVEYNLKSEVTFKENKGQWTEEVKFLTQTASSQILFTKTGIVYNHNKPVEGENGMDNRELLAWRLNFVNSNEVMPKGGHAVRANTNYLLGNDPSKFAIGVKDFDGITYSNLYEKIDLHYYANESANLKYDFILNPGFEIADIQLQAEGVEGLKINRKGQIEIETVWGALIEEAPYSYQLINGQSKEVDIRYNITGEKTFGFEIIGDYDPAYPIILDPTELEWFTYTLDVGGGYPWDIHVDKDGYTYLTGYCIGDIKTTPGVVGPSLAGAKDIFVQKLHPDGNKMEFTTYVGGSLTEMGTSITVNDASEIFVAGWTKSKNFPTSASAMQKTYKGTTCTCTEGTSDLPFGGDVVVFKLNKTATKLDYSTYVGGTGQEAPGRDAIEVNSNGEVFVNGYTFSNDFPVTAGAFKTTFQGGKSDGFLFKMKNDGSGMIYSTYYGGNNNDNYSSHDWDTSPIYGSISNWINIHMWFYHRAGGMVVNDAGEAYVAGWTKSDNFPTTPGAYQTIRRDNKRSYTDGFVFKMNAAGSNMIYSTFLGAASGHDCAIDIDIDDQGRAYVAGMTTSRSFETTANAHDRLNEGYTDINEYEDGFYLRLNAAGSALEYSTYIGGKDMEIASDIEVTKNYEVFINGYSTPSSECTAYSCRDMKKSICGFAEFIDGNPNANHEVFIMKYDASGDQVYSTFIGGSYQDYHPKMDLSERYECAEEITSTWSSHSMSPWETFAGTPGDLPITPNAYQKISKNTKNDNPVVARFRPDITSEFTTVMQGCNNPVQFNGQASGSCLWTSAPWNPTSWFWDFGDGNTSTEQQPVHNYAKDGQYEVMMVVGCPYDTVRHMITVGGGGSTSVDLGPDIKSCDLSNTELKPVTIVNGATYIWSTKETTSKIIVSEPGTYWVEINDGGCTAIDTIKVETSGFDLSVTADLSDGCDRIGGVNGKAIANAKGAVDPVTYQWNDQNNQTTDTATGLPVGTYTVVVKDGNGCELMDSVTIEEIIQIKIFVDTVPCTGCSDGAVTAQIGGTGQAPYTVRWDDENQQTSMTASGLPAGVYTVSVTDDNGCRNNATVTIGDTTATTGLDEYIVGKLTVYPNPGKGQLYINLESHTKPVLKVFDPLGKVINVPFTQAGKKLYINSSNLSPSVYLFYLIQENMTYTQRVVIH